MASTVKRVRKRDGKLVDFYQGKITNAIYKALFAIEGKDGDTAKTISDRVVEKLNKLYAGKTPGVEAIQDIVVETLRETGHDLVALDYQSYRERKAGLRTLRGELGILDEPKLTVNAIKVLERRYLLRDEEGNIIETPGQLFRRVARTIASVETKFNPSANIRTLEELFYSFMASQEFIPNTPTLMNAGAPLGQLSACFVLPIEDSIVDIFDTLKNMALIHQSGGGTGFSFSHLRPRGDMVRSTKGVASGPVSFMKIFDAATGVMKQGGKRRGANMGILNDNHPDIFEFVLAKSDETTLANFNISVGASDEFMEAAARRKAWPLINPRTGKEAATINASELLDMIVNNAWRSGDPGLIFLDEINS
jgi:ribonucleoside-diphosphate reductase alpha chain